MRRLLLLLALLAFAVPLGATDLQPMPFLKLAYYDSNGNPCSGCKLYSYVTTTDTPLATYTTPAGNVANANPVVLDSAGRANVYLLNQPYKMVLKNSANVVLWTVDPVETPAGATSSCPGGSDTQVQFNDSSACAGDAGLTYNKTTDKLSVGSGGVGIAGSSSGSVTVKTAAAAGSWSFTLPTTGGTANYFLQTDGSGVTTWAAAGGGTGCDISGTLTTQVIFNDAAACAGDTHLTWAKSPDTLTVGIDAGGTKGGTSSEFLYIQPNKVDSAQQLASNVTGSRLRSLVTGSHTTKGVEILHYRKWGDTGEAGNQTGLYVDTQDTESTLGTSGSVIHTFGIVSDTTSDKNGGTIKHFRTVGHVLSVYGTRELTAGEGASSYYLGQEIYVDASNSDMAAAQLPNVTGLFIDAGGDFAANGGVGLQYLRNLWVSGNNHGDDDSIEEANGIFVEDSGNADAERNMLVRLATMLQGNMHARHALLIDNQITSMSFPANANPPDDGLYYSIYTGTGNIRLGGPVTVDAGATAGSQTITFFGPSAGPPTTPSTGSYTFYIDSSDSNKLKVISGGATVTPLANY